MSGPALFSHPLWPRLAAMHLHFLWQGVLIAWLYWTILKLFAVQSSRVRYVLGMMGLLAMPVCMAATFWLAEVPNRRRNHHGSCNERTGSRLFRKTPHPNRAPPGGWSPEGERGQASAIRVLTDTDKDIAIIKIFGIRPP